mmetsp:Transcript_28101/g.49230  ORF Transcript_28101/g.49230 Transcript_28101/m.49230 type:complete len:98 (-) Transcript_28101:349-642(-)
MLGVLELLNSPPRSSGSLTHQALVQVKPLLVPLHPNGAGMATNVAKPEGVPMEVYPSVDRGDTSTLWQPHLSFFTAADCRRGGERAFPPFSIAIDNN